MNDESDRKNIICDEESEDALINNNFDNDMIQPGSLKAMKYQVKITPTMKIKRTMKIQLRVI